MAIKKKSLIVGLVSGYVVASVLVLTLVGYAAYMELKNENFIRSYENILQRLNARNYSKHIEFSRLNAGVEPSGALKGYPLVEGTIANNGTREVSDLLVKIKFLDRDGAVIYEALVRPLEPSLGAQAMPQVTIPRLPGSQKAILKPNSSLPFKKIMADCPKEVLSELKTGGGFAKVPTRWSGRFEVEMISLNF